MLTTTLYPCVALRVSCILALQMHFRPKSPVLPSTWVFQPSAAVKALWLRLVDKSARANAGALPVINK